MLNTYKGGFIFKLIEVAKLHLAKHLNLNKTEIRISFKVVLQNRAWRLCGIKLKLLRLLEMSNC